MATGIVLGLKESEGCLCIPSLVAIRFLVNKE